jgi:hypothetical protein
MQSAESPNAAGEPPASQDFPRRKARRTPWLLLGLFAVSLIVAVVAMLGWNTAITRADQQTSKAAAAQATASHADGLQQQVEALRQEIASRKTHDQALLDQVATATSELAQTRAKAAGLDAAEARAAAADKAAAEAERGRAQAQARLDTLELAARTADRRAPAPSPPGLVTDRTGRDYLLAARVAIRAGNAHAAQVALGRAETRLLNRASLAAGPDRPLHHPGVTEIERALDQLGAHDSAGAVATIDGLLAQP